MSHAPRTHVPFDRASILMSGHTQLVKKKQEHWLKGRPRPLRQSAEPPRDQIRRGPNVAEREGNREDDDKQPHGAAQRHTCRRAPMSLRQQPNYIPEQELKDPSHKPPNSSLSARALVLHVGPLGPPSSHAVNQNPQHDGHRRGPNPAVLQ